MTSATSILQLSQMTGALAGVLMSSANLFPHFSLAYFCPAHFCPAYFCPAYFYLRSQDVKWSSLLVASSCSWSESGRFLSRNVDRYDFVTNTEHNFKQNVIDCRLSSLLWGNRAGHWLVARNNREDRRRRPTKILLLRCYPRNSVWPAYSRPAHSCTAYFCPAYFCPAYFCPAYFCPAYFCPAHFCPA